MLADDPLWFAYTAPLYPNSRSFSSLGLRAKRYRFTAMSARNRPIPTWASRLLTASVSAPSIAGKTAALSSPSSSTISLIACLNTACTASFRNSP